MDTRTTLLLVGGYGEDLYERLGRTEYEIARIDSGAETIRRAHEIRFDVVLLSLRMNDATGFDVLGALREMDPDAPIIMSTHERSTPIVVEAMKRGCYDYITEPHADLEAVVAVIARAVAHRRMLLDNRRLRSELEGSYHFDGLVGKSSPITEVCRTIRQVAGTNSPVLVEGESGSGKELVARAIHHNSRRKGGPFVTTNCGSLSESLLENELFGHEKGSYTGADRAAEGLFEQADGGTLFLDEIGSTSNAFQVKLLRAIEEGEIKRVGGDRPVQVDVRIVSATNEPLEKLVGEGAFREDLLYRINVVDIRLPTLRDRREDIPLLAHHFLERFAREAHKTVRSISQAALERLSRHRWPGNIRELRNVIERAVVWDRDGIIGTEDLPTNLWTPADGAAGPADDSSDGLPIKERLAAYEKSLIENALAASAGVKANAARMLGMKRTTLLRRMRQLGVSEVKAGN